jgi:hypothetical protein
MKRYGNRTLWSDICRPEVAEAWEGDIKNCERNITVVAQI